MFIDIVKTLSTPGLLVDDKPSDEDYKYILCLIEKKLRKYKEEFILYYHKQNNNFNKDNYNYNYNYYAINKDWITNWKKEINYEINIKKCDKAA